MERVMRSLLLISVLMMAGCSHQHVQHKHPAEEELSAHILENKEQHTNLSVALSANLDDVTSPISENVDSLLKRLDEHEEAIEKLIGRLIELEGIPQKLIELGEKPAPKKKRKMKIFLDDWNTWEDWFHNLNKRRLGLGAPQDWLDEMNKWRRKKK